MNSQIPQVSLAGPDGTPITVTNGALSTSGGAGGGGNSVITDPVTATNQAKVTNTAAQDTDYGLVVRLPRRGTLTDRSTTITAGGTAQQLVAANTSRRYLLIINPLTATENLWVNFTTTAVTDSPSIGLAPGDSLVMEGMFVTTEVVSVIAATTGHKVTAKEG
jgi:hypothetical protein